MDPRRTPEKVLTGHPCDQMADLTGNPGTPTSPATTRSISPNRRPAVTAPTQDRIGLNDHQAFAPTSPPARQQNPKQSINATEARAPGSATAKAGHVAESSIGGRNGTDRGDTVSLQTIMACSGAWHTCPYQISHLKEN